MAMIRTKALLSRCNTEVLKLQEQGSCPLRKRYNMDQKVSIGVA